MAQILFRTNEMHGGAGGFHQHHQYQALLRKGFCNTSYFT